MKFTSLKTMTLVSVVSVFALSLNAFAVGQVHRSIRIASTQAPTLTAVLVDAEKKAKEQTATVQVTVTGVQLIDPASVKEHPAKGQGHLHYRVDDGPVIATPTPKLSFHGLTSGQHKILVMLAGNDHKPLGPEQTLTVTIP